jgi:photosystem II stability/assembly factor-like uncharacterized protein
MARLAARVALVAATLLLAHHSAPVVAQPAKPKALALRPVLDGLRARCIGPAVMGGRVVDLAVVESDPSTFYVATAGGGVWKTTDGGETLAPVFDDQPTMSTGSVAVCQGKPEVVYVGTGEGNPRNSVSWGGGVFKSVNGGKSWTFCGLKETHHIGRVVVHPTNPDIAYVAALGKFWSANKERGLYKTTDGGKTWAVSKFIDENTGFVDLQMDPADPDTLYAAAWQVRRDAFSGGSPQTQDGPNGGLFKTADGGKSWEKMGGGLPETGYGRCGLSIYRKDPNVVFAIVHTDKTAGALGNAGQPATRVDKDGKLSPVGPVETGGVFRSDDKGKTWKKINDAVPRPFYYGQIRVDPTDDQRVYVLGVAFTLSTDGGLTFSTGMRGTHADHHALWINPKNPDHLILGNDGGLYVSKDRAKSAEHMRGMVVSQFYGVAVDSRTPYRVYGGLQDNGSWGGPVATAHPDGVAIADWRRVGGGDGFQAAVDPTDPDTVYVESQYGNLTRVNLKAGKGGVKGGGGFGKGIRPTGAGGGKGGGKGGFGKKDEPKKDDDKKKEEEKKTDPKKGDDKKVEEKKDEPKKEEPKKGGFGGGARYNWNSPILLSPHDPKTLYYASQNVYKTDNRGDSWKRISPDLTRGPKEGRVANSGHTVLALAESPVKAGVLWAGTDDGNVWVTKNGGEEWIDLTGRIPSVPRDRAIPRIECSYFDEGTAFLAIDRHRNGDYRPYIFKTTDHGETWTQMTNGLPDGAVVGVVRQSSRVRDLLFAGTELGLYASLDGGRVWHHVDKTGLPRCVRVDDLVIHPRERDLVIGTHGRGIWVMDISPLEQLSEKVLTADAHLFDVRPATVLAEKERPQAGPKGFVAPNPPAVTVHYLIGAKAPDAVEITAAPAGAKGRGLGVVMQRPGPGLGQVAIDLRPGEYTITLKAGDVTQTKKVTVTGEPEGKAEEQKETAPAPRPVSRK